MGPELGPVEPEVPVGRMGVLAGDQREEHLEALVLFMRIGATAPGARVAVVVVAQSYLGFTERAVTPTQPEMPVLEAPVTVQGVASARAAAVVAVIPEIGRAQVAAVDRLAPDGRSSTSHPTKAFQSLSAQAEQDSTMVTSAAAPTVCLAVVVSHGFKFFKVMHGLLRLCKRWQSAKYNRF